MIVADTPRDLLAYVGKPLGISDWWTIDQAMIQRFADLTGDDNWVHIDTARAARDMPGGKTIAHGFLTLSMTPIMGRQIFAVKNHGRILNYGADNLRFPGAVENGAWSRLSMALTDAQERPDGGIRLVIKSTVTAEGHDKPVCVFDKLLLLYPRGK